MNVKDAVVQDRARRAEGNRARLSRRAYGELVGLSEQRVWSLEQGKRLKPGELEQLLPHLGDLLPGPDAGEPQEPEEAPQLDNRTQPVDYGADDWRAERQGLLAAYSYLNQRLTEGGVTGAPPFEWPSSHTIEGCPPGDLGRIRDWIQAVHEWLDGVREPEATPTSVGSTTLDDPPTQSLPGLPTDPSGPPADQTHPAPATTRPGPEQSEPTPQPTPVRSLPSPETTRLDASRDVPTDSPVRSSTLHPTPLTIEPLDPQYRYVTNGELRTWARCRRQWWFGYFRTLGLKAVQVTGPASIGTRVHRVLAAYYVPVGVERRDPWEVFEETLREDEKLLEEQFASPEKRERWTKEVDLARAMLEGYLEWVEETAADAGLTITAPETRLVADLRMPELPEARLLAKLDVRAVRQPDGARLFLDHKTRADLVPKTLHLDEQMLHYHLTEFLHLLDEGQDGDMRTDGAIYNMLRKVKRTATARPPFYGRVEVRHNLDELRSYWIRVKAKVLEITDARRRLEAGEDHRSVCYPMPTAECSYQCDYFQLCPMYDDGSRAEDFVQALYVEVNPLRRYEPDQVGIVG